MSPARFGVTGGSPSRKWVKLPDALRRRRIQRDVALMKAAGVRWTRVSLHIAQPPNPFDDYYFQLLHENDIEILGLLWFNSAPPDPVAFRKNIMRLVRYYPRIRVWEASNEPNLNSYWKGAPEDYVPALQIVFEAIKEADSTRQVSCAGMSEWKVEPFLDMMVRQEAWRWMDIFAYHPYAANPQAVANRLFAARSRFAGTPLHDKPTWITEIGFHTANWKNNAGHVASEEMKANYLEKTFAIMARFTQGPVFWYTFQEDFTGTTLGYGLLNQVVDPKAKPDVDPVVIYSAAYERFRAMSGAPSGPSDAGRQAQR